uniref:Protein kinase domain-containing protein n=1 Tax=Grammatophora oceanica TaxID=210454 RepID=A0A7S1VPS2_9STRA
MESLGHGPYVQEVDLSCEGNNRSMPVDCVKSPSPSKARVLVALAVLLNNFLEFFTDERKQKYRQESVVVAPVPNSLPSVFTRRTNRNENADKKSSKRQQSHTASTEGTSGKEVVAMKAAACGNLFRQIEYPWTRVVHFTDSDLVFEEQTESPFYFKALREMDRKKVFLKVWNSFEVETGDIEDEWHFQCKAYQAGVSVATLMSESLLRSSGEDNAEYLVLAMEFVESDSIRGALDCMLFSYKLIETVESLHTAAGMLHGDLKPRNVIWGKGVVTLIDFGRSSSIVSEERTCSRGTEGYEAPEILRGDPNTISTDAFAVGKTILWHIERLVKDEAALCSRLKGIAEGLASENPSTRWSLTRASKAIVVQLSSQNRSEEPQQGMNSYSQRSPPKKIARVSVGDLSVAVS